MYDVLLSVLLFVANLPPVVLAFVAAALTCVATVQSSEQAIRASSESQVLEATGRLSILELATMADFLPMCDPGAR